MAGKALKDVNSLCKCPACGEIKRMHYLCPNCAKSKRGQLRDETSQTNQYAELNEMMNKQAREQAD